MDKVLLKKLIDASSPSGVEDEVVKLVVEETRDLADEHLYDNCGSVTTVYNKDSNFKVNLMAHCDEISLVVTGYNPDGTLTVTANGGIRPRLYMGTRVKILTGTKVIDACMGVNRTLANQEKITTKDLFVDLGCTSAKEAKEIVPVGSSIIHNATFFELQNDFICARAFDDRLGVYITQEACKKAKKNGAKCGIYCSATTGEETTGRGAFSTGSMIKPDCSIIVDVTYATDEKGNELQGDVSLGKGGVICLGSTINRKLVKLIEEAAKELNLPVQYEVSTERTYTDGDTVLKANESVPFILFSIPLRYMHSPVEVASTKDIDSMIDVLARLIEKLDSNVDFKPYKF